MGMMTAAGWSNDPDRGHGWSACPSASSGSSSCRAWPVCHPDARMLCSYLLGSVTVYAGIALSLIERMRTSGIERALSKCYSVSMHCTAISVTAGDLNLGAARPRGGCPNLCRSKVCQVRSRSRASARCAIPLCSKPFLVTLFDPDHQKRGSAPEASPARHHALLQACKRTYQLPRA